MRNLFLSFLLLELVSSCCAADLLSSAQENVHISRAFQFTRELMGEKQKLFEAKAEYEKFTNKLANLNESTHQKLKEALTLDNEEAKRRAYVKADKYMRESSPHDLSHFQRLKRKEESLIEAHMKAQISGVSPFIEFNFTRVLGEGHYMLCDLIKDRNVRHQGYYPVVISVKKNLLEAQQRTVKYVEDKLAREIKSFSKNDFEKLEELTKQMERLNSSS